MQDNSFSQGKDPLSLEFHQPSFFWPRVHSVCSKLRSAVTTAWCLLMGKSGRIWPRLSLQVLLANSCPRQWRSLLCLLPTESSCPRSLSAPGLWHPPLSSLLHHNFTLLCILDCGFFCQPDLICFLLSQIPTTHVLIIMFFSIPPNSSTCDQLLLCLSRLKW